jgi:hypothetical protein
MHVIARGDETKRSRHGSRILSPANFVAPFSIIVSTSCNCGILDAPAFVAHPLNQQGSTLRGDARILAEVHPWPPERALDRYGNHSFIPRPWDENLPGVYTKVCPFPS